MLCSARRGSAGKRRSSPPGSWAKRGLARPHFSDTAEFTETEWNSVVRFDRASFDGRTWFDGAQFAGEAWFTDAQFGDKVWFGDGQEFSAAQFAGFVDFGQIRVDAAASQNLREDMKSADADSGSHPQVADVLAPLTPRERRVLAPVAEGYSNLGIAERLGNSISTIESQIASIPMKLGLTSTSESGRRDVNLRVLAALCYLRNK